MSEPVRLKDDPDFIRETGIKLDDALPATAHDLGALKDRLMRQVSVVSGAPGTPSLPRLPGSVAGSAAVKGAVVAAALASGYGLHGWLNPPPPPVVITVPAPMPVPVMVSVPVVTEAPVVHAPVHTEPRQRTAPPVITQVEPEPALPVVVEKPVEKPVEKVIEKPAPPTLAEQLRLYESGRTALKAGNHAVAVREFTRYVQDIPDGELWPEAAMGLLDALVRSEAWERAEHHAGALLASARMKSFSTEIHRARAIARASLGRCKGAADDVDAMPDGADRDRTEKKVQRLCEE